MSTLVIAGPAPPLVGHVALLGGKNAALPLLLAGAATSSVTLSAVPTGLLDVRAALALLDSVGAVSEVASDGVVQLRGAQRHVATGPAIRSTPLLLTALLGRLGAGSVPLPGGCAIGPRPIDEHLRVLRALGASVTVTGDRLVGEARGGLNGARLVLHHASTTATQVALLGAVLARGTSELIGANLRFENRVFMSTLTQLGATIHTEDDHLIIEGGGLGSGQARVPATGDEAFTWLVAGLVTGGAVSVGPIAPEAAAAEVALLRAAGAHVAWTGDRLSASGPVHAFAVRTGPPPALGSDVQPLAAALAACAVGRSVIDDPRFPERFAYVSGLAAMGVRVDLVGASLTITGEDHGGGGRIGATVEAPDLRGGMALVLAALGARGESRITHFERVERGYEHVLSRLTGLGAAVTLL